MNKIIPPLGQLAKSAAVGKKVNAKKEEKKGDPFLSLLKKEVPVSKEKKAGVLSLDMPLKVAEAPRGKEKKNDPSMQLMSSEKEVQLIHGKEVGEFFNEDLSSSNKMVEAFENTRSFKQRGSGQVTLEMTHKVEPQMVTSYQKKVDTRSSLGNKVERQEQPLQNRQVCDVLSEKKLVLPQKIQLTQEVKKEDKELPVCVEPIVEKSAKKNQTPLVQVEIRKGVVSEIEVKEREQVLKKEICEEKKVASMSEPKLQEKEKSKMKEGTREQGVVVNALAVSSVMTEENRVGIVTSSQSAKDDIGQKQTEGKAQQWTRSSVNLKNDKIHNTQSTQIEEGEPFLVNKTESFVKNPTNTMPKEVIQPIVQELIHAQRGEDPVPAFNEAKRAILKRSGEEIKRGTQEVSSKESTPLIDIELSQVKAPELQDSRGLVEGFTGFSKEVGIKFATDESMLLVVQQEGIVNLGEESEGTMLTFDAGTTRFAQSGKHGGGMSQDFRQHSSNSSNEEESSFFSNQTAAGISPVERSHEFSVQAMSKHLFSSPTLQNQSAAVAAVWSQMEKHMQRSSRSWVRIDLDLPGGGLGLEMRVVESRLQIRLGEGSSELKEALVRGWDELSLKAKDRGVALEMTDFMPNEAETLLS